jgi:outer membrane protein OmpA-like peptidoglycan-associated protein
LLSIVLWALPSLAAAQQAPFDLQLFLPPAAGGTTFTVDRPTVPRHLSAVFGLSASYALDPLVRSELVEDGNVLLPAASVVRHLGQAELMAALGLFEYLELGVAVPVGLVDGARNDLLSPGYTYGTGVGMADVRLSAKVPILRGDFALAARFVTHLPTGDSNNYLGNAYWVATPSVVFAWAPGPLTVGGELGYRFRQRSAVPGFEQDDEIHVGLGATVPIVPEVELMAESQLRIGVGGRTVRANEVPWDVGGGVRVWPVRGFSIEAGVATGILAGYGAAPVRAFVALRFATEQGESCRNGPEDNDGFEDGDFCADVDNDADGRPDADDRCPNDPEDADEFADDDGCPDPDNDADGVLDGEDSCPTQSEDRDGFQDDDGCPEPDNDQDGVADGLDDCPMEPEDLDSFQDDDGCPEPGPAAASVTVTDTRILISERIYFDYDRDTIRSVSMPLLDQVALVIQELRSELRVRIDGYTDNEGSEAYNVDLSYRRARAVVEYLVGRGVARSRLEYRGYGPRNPVAPNDSPEGRALNRRVEFTILNEGEAATPSGSERRRRER